MNNEQAKAKFFALYLGQKVLRFDQWDDDALNTNLVGRRLDDIKHYYLQLRDIAALTDNEIIHIANMYGWGDSAITKERFDERVLQFKIDLPCICIPGYHHKHMGFVFDYLRSISILIPFTCLIDGKPVTYSTQQLIDFGWCKIKEK